MRGRPYPIPALAAALLVSSCTLGRGGDGTSSAVDRHAAVAADVMGRVRGPLPARAAALQVTGANDSTTIDALVANGTTWNGTVVLRIVSRTVDTNGSTEQSSACFRYRFVHPRTEAGGQPEPVSCPAGRPLDLNRPALPDGIDETTQRTAARVLTRAAAPGRLTAAMATRDLRHVLGPDYTYELGDDPQLGGFVRYGDECLQVSVTVTRARVSTPRSGNDCFGG